MHESKPDAAPFWRSVGRRAAMACSGPASATVAAVERGLARYLFWGLLAALAAVALLSLGAQEALAAPGGGGGDAISQTLEKVRNYLAGLAFGVGGSVSSPPFSSRPTPRSTRTPTPTPRWG
jgi:hypothetical protein